MAESFAVPKLRPDFHDAKNSRPESSERENPESDDSDWVRVERKCRRRRNRNDVVNRNMNCDLRSVIRSDAYPVDDFEPSDSGCGKGYSPKKSADQRRKKSRSFSFSVNKSRSRHSLRFFKRNGGPKNNSLVANHIQKTSDQTVLHEDSSSGTTSPVETNFLVFDPLTKANISKRFGESSSVEATRFRDFCVESCDEIKSSSGVSSSSSVSSVPSSDYNDELNDSISCIDSSDELSLSEFNSTCFSPTLLCHSEDEDNEQPTLSFISSSSFKASSPINKATDVYETNQTIDVDELEYSLFLPYRKTVQDGDKLIKSQLSFPDIPECPYSRTRPLCKSQCPFVHEVDIAHRPPIQKTDITGEFTNREKIGYLKSSLKINSLLDTWGESAYLERHVQYEDALREVFNPPEQSREKPVRGPYTCKGLQDADALYPCTLDSPCLIDSLTLREHKKLASVNLNQVLDTILKGTRSLITNLTKNGF